MGLKAYRYERARRRIRREIWSRRKLARDFPHLLRIVQTQQGERLQDTHTGEIFFYPLLPIGMILKMYYPASMSDEIHWKCSPLLACLPKTGEFSRELQMV